MREARQRLVAKRAPRRNQTPACQSRTYNLPSRYHFTRRTVSSGGCGIFILAVARYFGGELGGTKLRQYSIAGLLTVLWLLYLILSGLRAYGNI